MRGEETSSAVGCVNARGLIADTYQNKVAQLKTHRRLIAFGKLRQI